MDPRTAESIPFGHVGGRKARLHTLRNEMITAKITDFGGILVSLEAPDRSGQSGHVVLGFDDIATYASVRGSFGALLGRNANRIAGGRFTVDGQDYQLSTNENGSTLHGGPVGFGKRFWSVAAAEARRLVLTLVSDDGDQGFPGRVEVEATYELIGAALKLTLRGRTSKPTPLSISAHPYFNLDGPEAKDCLDHIVEIFAQRYLPTDEGQIPTGERRAVADGPFDFTRPKRMGDHIRQSDAQLSYGRGYDHYFILPDDESHALRPAVRVSAPASGRTLEILTTQRGVQFYSGNNLDGSIPGRSGLLYRQSAGFAVEPQGFPNAPNQPDFPPTLLRPGEIYQEEIVYRLGIEGMKA